MTGIFQHLHHLCIVVNDLLFFEKTVAYYESPRRRPLVRLSEKGAYLESDVPNKAASDAMRYKCCDIDNVQIQLCDPGSLDSPETLPRRERGGVYRLGFEVADRDAAGQRAAPSASAWLLAANA